MADPFLPQTFFSIYEYIYIYTYIYIYIYIYVCMYLCIYVCMHVCMYVCMHVCICMHKQELYSGSVILRPARAMDVLQLCQFLMS